MSWFDRVRRRASNWWVVAAVVVVPMLVAGANDSDSREEPPFNLDIPHECRVDDGDRDAAFGELTNEATVGRRLHVRVAFVSSDGRERVLGTGMVYRPGETRHWVVTHVGDTGANHCEVSARWDPLSDAEQHSLDIERGIYD